MASREILAGENPTIYFLLRATTDGQPLINKAYGDFTVYYSAIKTDGSGLGPTQVSLTGAGTLNAYNSGTLIKVDDTNQPGLYQLCLPTAVSTAGYREVRVGIRCTGAFTLAETVIVKQFNSQSATPNVSVAGFNKTTLDAGADGDKNFSDFINNSASLGGAAVRNAAVPRVNDIGSISAIKAKTDLLNAGATGMIKADVQGAMGTAMTQAAGAGKVAGSLSKLLDVATPVFTCASVNQTGDSYPVVTQLQVDVGDVILNLGNVPSAATNAAAVWDLATSGHTTAGTFGATATGIVSTTDKLVTAMVQDGLVWKFTTNALEDAPAAPTAADNATAAATAILATPANKLATDAVGAVTADVDEAAIASAVATALGTPATAAQVSAIIAWATNITVKSAVTGATIEIVQGDAYLAADSARRLTFTKAAGAAWPTNISGSGTSVTLYASRNARGTDAGVPSTDILSVAGVVTQATGDAQSAYVALTSAQTALTPAANGYDFALVYSDGTSPQTLVIGTMSVLDRASV